MADNKSIAIILCTYRGEAYLPECLDSILAQTAANTIVYIADDRSPDHTEEIILQYQMQYPARIVYLGENQEQRGACRNFLAALMDSRTRNADYYMFADQDDVWLPNKIARSVEAIAVMEERFGADVPLLAHCDSRVVDADLQEIAPSYTAYLGMDQTNHRFPHLLVQNVVTGGATIFNHALYERMQVMPTNVVMHDHWAALVAAAFGHITYINEPLYAYRQHTDNVVGARKGGAVREVLSRLGLESDGDKEAADQASSSLYTQLFQQAASFREIYAEELSEEQCRVLDAFSAMPGYGRLRKIYTVLRYGLTYDRFYRTVGELIFI